MNLSLPSAKTALSGPVLLALAIWLAIGPHELDGDGRLSLFVFAAATVLWTTTRFPPGFVALAAAASLVVLGAATQDALTASLGSPIVWLMIGAFILGEAIAVTGLGGRLARWIAARARSVDQLFWLVSAALLPLTALVPSTSGRAAIALSLSRSLEPALQDDATRRALSLLMPLVILTTTVAALTGAGSHLIANDILHASTGRRIGFLDWAMWGVPFALAAGGLTCLAVTRLFLTRAQREVPLPSATEERSRWSVGERRVAWIAVATVALWTTEGWHGLRIETVALFAALVLVSPLGVLGWKQGLAAVSWDLVLFVAGALVLGRALIDSGAAAWFAAQASTLLEAAGAADGRLWLVLVLAAVTIASHLFMTSHAARAAALTPPLIAFAQASGLDPEATVFIGTVGMNYCLTLPVSSKALLMFQGVDHGLRSCDLLRIGIVLAPLHVLLIAVFAFGYWPWTGLAL